MNDELVNEAKLGDKNAFTKLIILVKDDLYKIARIRLENEDDTYEVVQEAIMKAFISIKKLKHSEYFKTWIIKILINECNNMYRKNKHNMLEFNDELKNESYSKEIENSISDINFYFLIKNLDANEQMLLVMYYLNELSIKEISDILNVSENAVRTRLCRCKEKLRKNLEGGELYG